MKKLLIPFFTISILVSCGEETEQITAQSGDAVSNVSADADLSPAQRKKMEENYKKEAKAQADLESSYTTLKFDKMVHDFGTVKPDTDNFVQVTVTNTGNRPLIISDVSSTCGCTMPKKPEAPIAPGQTDIIEVKFHSKPGQLGEVSKTVSVTSNTKEVISTFEIKAFVEE
ncbi:MAG: DUF1573 domain-containing protein [Crocinitomicaceae bacterium]|nr:DUF1573 domain-containing protein [Crocinitomicaceae bacterium]